MDIRLVNLTKIFADKNQSAVRAVDNVDIHIPSGKLIGLLGPSGCGKSTTLYMIAGLLEPTSGQIFFGDEDVTALSPEKRGIGLVFQNFNLFPHLTVLKNCMLAEELEINDKLKQFKKNNKSKKEQQAYYNNLITEAQQKALLILDELGLSDKIDKYPYQLSGGEQQRVSIARALVLNPKILCFDEPTSALDPGLTGEVVKLINELKEQKLTMIIITHEMDFAYQVADKIIVIDKGQIIEEKEM